MNATLEGVKQRKLFIRKGYFCEKKLLGAVKPRLDRSLVGGVQFKGCQSAFAIAQSYQCAQSGQHPAISHPDANFHAGALYTQPESDPDPGSQLEFKLKLKFWLRLYHVQQ